LGNDWERYQKILILATTVTSFPADIPNTLKQSPISIELLKKIHQPCNNQSACQRDLGILSTFVTVLKQDCASNEPFRLIIFLFAVP
jgi:hypothetical protein